MGTLMLRMKANDLLREDEVGGQRRWDYFVLVEKSFLFSVFYNSRWLPDTADCVLVCDYFAAFVLVISSTLTLTSNSDEARIPHTRHSSLIRFFFSGSDSTTHVIHSLIIEFCSLKKTLINERQIIIVDEKSAVPNLRIYSRSN
jgi:hypothetical protein